MAHIHTLLLIPTFDFDSEVSPFKFKLFLTDVSSHLGGARPIVMADGKIVLGLGIIQIVRELNGSVSHAYDRDSGYMRTQERY